ncbi:Hypothetical protein HVR_LOCUS661 [uncultured virus]|nr:Hypothetical protein HVR_LOCUS661 [uncultured virus]
MDRYEIWNHTQGKHDEWGIMLFLDRPDNINWITGLSLLSYDEILNIFEQTIIKNNWSFRDRLIVNPKFNDDVKYVYENGILTEFLPTCCDVGCDYSCCLEYNCDPEYPISITGNYYNYVKTENEIKYGAYQPSMYDNYFTIPLNHFDESILEEYYNDESILEEYYNDESILEEYYNDESILEEYYNESILEEYYNDESILEEYHDDEPLLPVSYEDYYEDY